MPVPEHFHRFWRRLDEQVAHVEATWWGAVVTDSRFPAVSDANYARIDAATRDLTVSDVEAELLPALARSGAGVMHVVSFHPDEHEALFQELEGRGHRRTWDAVMDLAGDPPPDAAEIQISEPETDAIFWTYVERSFALFGVEPRETAVQLLDLEQGLERAGVKRWFAVTDGAGAPVSMAALILFDEVGYVDNVCTVPEARGRGYASAVTARAVREARDAGARFVTLLVDPDDAAVIGMYERLGFVVAARIAASRGPAGDQSGGAR